MSAPRELEGVSIDVESLFAVSVDFSHLRVTITAILDALRRAAAKSETLERALATQQTKVDSLDKTVAAGQAKIEAMDSTVTALGSQVRSLTTQLSTANERLNVAEKLGAEAAARIVDLEAKDAANAAKIAALEKSMKTMEGYKIPATFADHQARIAALEASDKELRTLLALGNDKADAAAKAAAAAAAAAGKPIPVAAAPVSSGGGNNNDALMQRLKSALEALTTRVAALEARPVSAASAAPALARAPSKSGSGSSGSGSSDLDRDQLAQHARQLAASATELSQIQAALAELKKLVATKASMAQVDKKADTDALRALETVVEKLTDRVKELEREVALLKDQMAALQDANRALAAKLQALLEASSCGACRSARPSVKCGKCNLSLCEECDEKLHGAAAAPAMQAHLRTPIGAVPTVVEAAPSSHRSAPLASSDSDELRRWAEEQFGLLNRKEKATRVDINDLGNKERDLRAKLEALLRAQADDKANFAEMSAALKKLESDLRALINTSGMQSRNYTDSRLDDLLAKLRDMEKSMDRGLKSELKRFERDVLVFMESHDGSNHAGSDAAVGKIHFRCLSCDQTVGNLQGPASLLYARAVGTGSNGSTTIGLNQGSGTSNMSIERGRELYLNGRDGAVYKGRDASNVNIALGDPQRPSQFAVSYANQNMGSTTNTRGTTILDQKTVASPYAAPGDRDRSNTPQSRGGMGMTRPQSAPYEDPLAMSARSNASSLPPTRPATRSGLRSRQGGREQAQLEATPPRELQQQQQQQQLTGSF